MTPPVPGSSGCPKAGADGWRYYCPPTPDGGVSDFWVPCKGGMSVLARVGLFAYRLVAGYGHCCPPNHVAACRLAARVGDGPRCGGFDEP